MYRFPLFILVFFLLALPGGCGSKEYLPTVDEVDLERYAGLWYEIARLPNRFERDLKCVTAEYTLREDGKIQVTNRGVNVNDPSDRSEANGTARVPDDQFPGQLRVVFFWPFGGDYYIIELDHDYQHALIGSPDREYLWILARDSKLEDAAHEKLVKRASELGFPTSELHYPAHDCD